MPDLVRWDRGYESRMAPHLFPPGALRRAINVLPDELGSLTARPGISRIHATALNGPIHSQYSVYETPPGGFSGSIKHRYQVRRDLTSGLSVLTRDFTATLASGLVNQPVDFTDQLGFNDTTIWTYFANGNDDLRKKDNGLTLYQWGIDTPGAAPVLAGGGPGGALSAGTYSVVVTFVRYALTVPTIESNPSVASLAVTVAASDDINVTDIPVSFDPQVTHVHIYRTTANGGIYLFDHSVTNGTTTATLSKPDNELGELVQEDNNRPPAFISITSHFQHICGLSGVDNILYVSKRYRGDSFPIATQLFIGQASERPQMVRSIEDRLYVWTTAKLYEIIAGSGDETQWYPAETKSPTGIEVNARFTISRGLRGIYWKGVDGLYRYDGGSAQNITDEKLFPLFNHRVVSDVQPYAASDALDAMAAGACYEGRYYFSYQDALAQPASLVYDELTDTYWQDTRQFLRYVLEPREHLFLGSHANGLVYDVVDRTMETDDGTAILVAIQTADQDEGAPAADKELVDLTVDLLSHGSPVVVSAVLGYGTSIVPLGTISTTAHEDLVLNTLELDVVSHAIGYGFAATAPFSLYRLLPQVLTLPRTRKAYHLLLQEAGQRAFSVPSWLTLDVELLAPGTLQATLLYDTESRVLPLITTVGRHRTTRLRLPTSSRARLLGLTISSTADFRLWGGELALQPLGGHEGVSRVPLVSAGGGG